MEKLVSAGLELSIAYSNIILLRNSSEVAGWLRVGCGFEIDPQPTT
jgi:hypothetical protein